MLRASCCPRGEPDVGGVQKATRTTLKPYHAALHAANQASCLADEVDPIPQAA